MGPSTVTDCLEFGEGLRRIGAVANFLGALQDGDPLEAGRFLHQNVSIAPVIGITPAQGYSGLGDALTSYMTETRDHDVQIQPELSTLSVAADGAVRGQGKVQITVAGVTDEATAEVLYEFRDGLISSIKGHLCAPSAQAKAR